MTLQHIIFLHLYLLGLFGELLKFIPLILLQLHLIPQWYLKFLPCAIQLNGEYGVNKVYAGVPVIIGKNGVEKIEQVDLDEKEKKEFMHSIDAVRALWEAASKIDPDLSK